MVKITNTIFDEDTGIAMEYRELIKNTELRPVCIKSFANEVGRLAQVVGGKV